MMTAFRQSVIFPFLFVAALLCSCSSVGPGLANHPLDCAAGFKWADCLPGTAGYNNGGGQLTRAEEAKQQLAAINEKQKAANEQCKIDMRNTEIDPIRNKVELIRETFDSPVPFQIATLDTFPTTEDLPAIMKWATTRELCVNRFDAASTIPPSATPLQVAFIQQDRSFIKQAVAGINELIVSLYQQKLTYGEFAKKRYEISRDAALAERQFRQSTLLADQERQAQAQQLAQQQFQNNLATWSVYMQSVNARQPQTIHLNCSSYRIGNTVNTNCN
jgi:hypothetical protein